MERWKVGLLVDVEMEAIRRALQYHQVHCTVRETGSCDGPTDEEYERAERDVRAERTPSLFEDAQ